MRRATNVRPLLIQSVGVALFAGLLVGGATTAWVRLREQGAAYGFDILLRPTGWTVNSPFLSQTADDPYWWSLVVGLANTAAVGVVGIVLATLLGFAIGTGRLSGNSVIRTICLIYVEVFRNIPLILQAVFWYITFSSMPTPRGHPPTLFGLVYLTNKGLYLPAITVQPDAVPILWSWIAAAVALTLLRPVSRRLGRAIEARHVAMVMLGLVVVLALYVALAGSPLRLAAPTLAGFNFIGGHVVPLEIIALTFAIVVFSAAYISEIVRGGLLSVPHGQIEAAISLGLRQWAAFRMVRLPIGLRSMIPPLSNQYIFVIKSTALGIAVGYSDIFSVSVVSISQTGQAVEFLLVMMLSYFILNYSLTQLMAWFDRALAFRTR